VHDVVVLVVHLEVWDIERSDGGQRQRERLVDLLSALPGPEFRAYLPQRAEDLRSIKALSLTVFAEIRHRLIPPT
jgi:hypothetical protein